MKTKAILKGIFPAIVSPCDAEDRFLEESFAKQTTNLYRQGVQGLYVCGATGDCFSMRVDERKRAAEIAVGVAREFAGVTIAHVGAGNMRDSLELAEHAAKIGADAISSMPPRNKSYDQLMEYYSGIARASELPVLVYYIPALSAWTITVDDMVGLLDIEGVVGLKFSDYDLFFLQRLLLARPDATVFNGNDEILTLGLLYGAHGGIGMFYNVFPRLFVGIYTAVGEGDVERALHLQRLLMAFLDVAFRYGTIETLSAMLTARGCGPHFYRRPRPAMSSALLDELLARIQPLVDAIDAATGVAETGGYV